MYTFGFTLFYLGGGALLVAGLAMDLPNSKIIRFSAYLGSHSYSIYLWHFAVSIWLVPIVARLAGSYWRWPTYAVVLHCELLVYRRSYWVCSSNSQR